jgi:hypothetical protein
MTNRPNSQPSKTSEKSAAEHEEQLTRERRAQHQIEEFQQSQTGAGVTLSRMSGPKSEKHPKPVADYLSERRDTQGPMTDEDPERRASRVSTMHSRKNKKQALDRWENEGGNPAKKSD